MVARVPPGERIDLEHPHAGGDWFGQPRVESSVVPLPSSRVPRARELRVVRETDSEQQSLRPDLCHYPRSGHQPAPP